MRRRTFFSKSLTSSLILSSVFLGSVVGVSQVSAMEDDAADSEGSNIYEEAHKEGSVRSGFDAQQEIFEEEEENEEKRKKDKEKFVEDENRYDSVKEDEKNGRESGVSVIEYSSTESSGHFFSNLSRDITESFVGLEPDQFESRSKEFLNKIGVLGIELHPCDFGYNCRSWPCLDSVVTNISWKLKSFAKDFDKFVLKPILNIETGDELEKEEVRGKFAYYFMGSARILGRDPEYAVFSYIAAQIADALVTLSWREGALYQEKYDGKISDGASKEDKEKAYFKAFKNYIIDFSGSLCEHLHYRSNYYSKVYDYLRYFNCISPVFDENSGTFKNSDEAVKYGASQYEKILVTEGDTISDANDYIKTVRDIYAYKNRVTGDVIVWIKDKLEGTTDATKKFIDDYCVGVNRIRIIKPSDAFKYEKGDVTVTSDTDKPVEDMVKLFSSCPNKTVNETMWNEVNKGESKNWKSPNDLELSNKEILNLEKMCLSIDGSKDSKDKKSVYALLSEYNPLSNTEGEYFKSLMTGNNGDFAVFRKESPVSYFFDLESKAQLAQKQNDLDFLLIGECAYYWRKGGFSSDKAVIDCDKLKEAVGVWYGLGAYYDKFWNLSTKVLDDSIIGSDVSSGCCFSEFTKGLLGLDSVLLPHPVTETFYCGNDRYFFRGFGPHNLPLSVDTCKLFYKCFENEKAL